MMTDSFPGELVALIPRLRRFARALAGDADRADDLVQDALEKALSRREQFEAGSRLDSWLYSIIRNRWISDWRRRRTRGEEVDMNDAIDLPGMDGREEYERHQRLAAAQAALGSLPPQQRETVVLVLVEGLSYREAGAVMGVSEGTVASRLARAKTALEVGLPKEAQTRQ